MSAASALVRFSKERGGHLCYCVFSATGPLCSTHNHKPSAVSHVFGFEGDSIATVNSNTPRLLS